MTRYVIIGTGVSAIAAAEAIRLADNQGELSIVSEDPFVYYSRPGLAYYLTGEIPEKLLFPYKQNHYQKLNAQVYHRQCPANPICRKNHPAQHLSPPAVRSIVDRNRRAGAPAKNPWR